MNKYNVFLRKDVTYRTIIYGVEAEDTGEAIERALKSEVKWEIIPNSVSIEVEDVDVSSHIDVIQ